MKKTQLNDSIGTAFCNGIEDRHVNGLLEVEQLYRHGLAQRIAWRVGWKLADALTGRALRTQLKGQVKEPR